MVIVVAGIFYALVARFALEGYPYSGDEYSTVLQAEGFARGVLKAPAPGARTRPVGTCYGRTGR